MIEKFLWKHKRLGISKAILSKKSNAGGITIPDFKLYYRARATKAAWFWDKNRHEDQWNIIEALGINPHSYTHLIFDKIVQNIRWRKASLFNKYCWKKWISVCRRLKLDPCLSPCTSINLKWIEDINVRPETLKIVQEKAMITLKLIGIDNDFYSECKWLSN
jgi:hypothetical protein